MALVKETLKKEIYSGLYQIFISQSPEVALADWLIKI